MRVYCPVCGSDNVEWLIPQTWSMWRCKDCGYIGALIIEDGELAKKIREEWNRKHEKKE